jgi:hypothetical protein
LIADRDYFGGTHETILLLDPFDGEMPDPRPMVAEAISGSNAGIFAAGPRPHTMR